MTVSHEAQNKRPSSSSSSHFMAHDPYGSQGSNRLGRQCTGIVPLKKLKDDVILESKHVHLSRVISRDSWPACHSFLGYRHKQKHSAGDIDYSLIESVSNTFSLRIQLDIMSNRNGYLNG